MKKNRPTRSQRLWNGFLEAFYDPAGEVYMRSLQGENQKGYADPNNLTIETASIMASANDIR